MSVTNSQIDPPWPVTGDTYCEGVRTCPTCDGAGIDPMSDESSLIADLICVVGAAPKCSTCEGEGELTCGNPTEYNTECDICGYENPIPEDDDQDEDPPDTDYGDWRNA